MTVHLLKKLSNSKEQDKCYYSKELLPLMITSKLVLSNNCYVSSKQAEAPVQTS